MTEHKSKHPAKNRLAPAVVKCVVGWIAFWEVQQQPATVPQKVSTNQCLIKSRVQSHSSYGGRRQASGDGRQHVNRQQEQPTWPRMPPSRVHIAWPSLRSSPFTFSSSSRDSQSCQSRGKTRIHPLSYCQAYIWLLGQSFQMCQAALSWKIVLEIRTLFCHHTTACTTKCLEHIESPTTQEAVSYPSFSVWDRWIDSSKKQVSFL